MFGYIRPCKPELKIKEFEAFRGVYCGLCHQLGHSFGPFARLTLSYDLTFLAMIYYAQGGHAAKLKWGRCCVNPLRRVPVCESDDVLRYSADIAALTVYHNLADNIEDSIGLKRLGFRLLHPLVKPAARLAAEREPEAGEAVAELMRRQREVESSAGGCLDAAAEPTASMLSEICGRLGSDDAQRRVLERVGYLIGRYIYLCDALEDIEQDMASGGFNPLIGERLRENHAPGDLEAAREYARDSLMLTIGEAAKALELLKLEDFGPIIRNIVYLGMPEQVRRIHPKKEKVHGRPV